MLSSDVGVRKPDPKIFELALDRIGTSRTTTVFAGNDWTADVLGAQAVGLRGIYVNDRAIERSQVTSRVPRAMEAAPTLEAIARALHVFGWQEVAP